MPHYNIWICVVVLASQQGMQYILSLPIEWEYHFLIVEVATADYRDRLYSQLNLNGACSVSGLLLSAV